MMRKTLPFFTALALTGCMQAPADPATADMAQSAASAPEPPVRYTCADGSTVDARYPTTETAQILHDGKTTDLTIAVSASGARYVGGGWQWWTKGMTEGTLSPLKPGEEIAEAIGVICTAG